MSYHSFKEDGHVCPQCGAGPFACMAEDGHCDNDGDCDKCVQSYCTGDPWECSCQACNSPS